MKPIIYVLPGNPVPLARPRFGKNRIFDCQKLLKVNHGIVLNSIHNNRPLYKGPLVLDVTFFLPIGGSFSEKKRANLENTGHKNRPDLDNLVKYILDASNKILFHDDSLISVIHAQKIYSKDPKTVFTITELNDAKTKET